MNTPAWLSPPSVVYPLAGGVLGYLMSDKNPWGAAAGVLFGALFNASAKSVAVESQSAQAQGAASFTANYGGEMISNLLGSKKAPGTVTPATQAASGALITIR